ncbi:MAG TPA: energy transducer TonB [Candidatus Sulfopaludibacter sp.]|nr:energy transducer TonB [Candidatus Sulfopaludibacter sp.]
MPGELPRVLVSERVVSGLRALAIKNLLALPRRGVETGGILFGRAHDGELVVDGFEEVPCEHRYGPSYALSEEDRANLDRVLAERPGWHLPVIGLFRSFAARNAVIEEADEVFVSERFPRGDFLFLALFPRSVDVCVAGVRFFRDGRLLPETDDLARPFDAQQMPLMMESERRVELPPSHRALQEAALQQAAAPAEPPLPVPVAAPARRRSWSWASALLCVVIGVSGAIIYQLWGLAREPRWRELHLDARPHSGRLELSWDGNAPAAVHATRGLLAVTDGGAHRDILLGPAEIHAGLYAYTPVHPDGDFRVILYSSGLGVAGDAVRFETAPAPVVPAEAAVAASTAVTQHGEADRAAEAQPPSAAVPPVAVHEVHPAISEGIRSRITGQVVVPVQVEVSARGRVTKAVAEAQSDDVRRYLAAQAQKAAREWRFTPARDKSGERVASSKTIQFVFTP